MTHRDLHLIPGVAQRWGSAESAVTHELPDASGVNGPRRLSLAGLTVSRPCAKLGHGVPTVRQAEGAAELPGCPAAHLSDVLRNEAPGRDQLPC